MSAPANQKFIVLYRNTRGTIKVTNNDTVNFDIIDKVPLTNDNSFILKKWVVSGALDVIATKEYFRWLNNPDNLANAKNVLSMFRILADIRLVNNGHPLMPMYHEFITQIVNRNWYNLIYLAEQCSSGNSLLKEPQQMVTDYNESEYEKNKNEYHDLCKQLGIKPIICNKRSFVNHFSTLRKMNEDRLKQIEKKEEAKDANKTVSELEPTEHEVKILEERVSPTKGHELLIQGTTSTHTKKEIKEFEKQGYVVNTVTKVGRKWKVDWKDSWVAAKYIYLEQLRDGVPPNNAE